MKSWWIVLFALSSALYSYTDGELDQLWSSVSDINNPTLEDYRLIEDYLRSGRRPYLDGLVHSQFGDHNKFGFIRNFALVGPNQELPILEKYSLNVTEETKDRCVLIFGSYNGIYPQKAKKILAELQENGYSGHVLLRVGGFPNTPNGGLSICYVPYSFKVAFLQEARMLGFKEVLWIDTAIHPVTNLNKVFSLIKKRGFFFTYVGTLRSNQPSHLTPASDFLGISDELYDRVYHISSAILGLNMTNKKALDFLDMWYRETEKVYGNITGFPEELCLSITAFRSKLIPYSWFGNYVCADNELPTIGNSRPMLQFYLDGFR